MRHTWEYRDGATRCADCGTTDASSPCEDVDIFKCVHFGCSNPVRGGTACELHSTESSVNHPAHYGGDTIYECIKVLRAWNLDKSFCLGNAVKYISRAGKKDSAKTIEDLRKAVWYLNKQIEWMEEE